MSSSRVWRRVDILLTDVSDEGIASLSLQLPAHAGSSLPGSYTLKMEATRSSETSVNKVSTRRHIPEDGILQIT
jgi:hypothetical protein